MTQNLPALPVEEFGTGYEDLDDEIQSVPRLKIDHKKGVFKDGDSGEEIPVLTGVMMGVVKQRVMFPSEVGETPSKPMCKSNDARTGYPNMEPEKDDGFPFSETSLDPNTLPTDEHGRKIISCAECPMSQWRENPKNPKKNLPPPCKERHTYPIFYKSDGQQGQGYDAPYDNVALIAFQGSGIQPSKKYVSVYKRTKRPLYSGVVSISLDVNKRGMVEYSVPKFVKIGDVPEDEWVTYAEAWPDMKEFLTRAPRADDDGSDPAKSGGMSAAQAARNAGVVEAEVVEDYATASNTTQPTGAPATPVVEDDDDFPF